MDRRAFLATVLVPATVLGCGPKPGAAGLWDLRVGGRAKVVGEGGASEVTLETLPDPTAKGRKPLRKGEAPPVETVFLSTGTRVDVLAIDGDDARVSIADGPHAGSVYWIGCRLLETITE
ncbi:hypothetical protein [Paludisphaera rhizosphaerae]|uniref:hypothetical protein n=1 Tax=Paludisphaera rhizosphaerae TaxID=2711216 RepID=UPI0013EABBB7|nr:hypothetical protein [Paludisphaera rhizosphaerae]